VSDEKLWDESPTSRHLQMYTVCNGLFPDNLNIAKVVSFLSLEVAQFPLITDRYQC